ncbi:MAG: hypothetical protein ACL93V_16670 [Candidatus Electrothrix sp. YB6]
MIKKIWKDPVFSKLIAAALIWVLGILYLELSPKFQNINWLTKISLLLIPTCFLLLWGGISRLIRKIKKSKVLVYLSTGGTCRDPIAKVITEQLLNEKGLNLKLEIKAMAVSDSSDLKVSYGAKYAIKSVYGKDLLSNHKCRQITKDIFENADLIIVMSQDVLKMLELKFPQRNERVYLFKEFFGLSGDVTNPWPDGQDEETLKRYLNCVNEIKSVLVSYFDKLVNALAV